MPTLLELSSGACTHLQRKAPSVMEKSLNTNYVLEDFLHKMQTNNIAVYISVAFAT